MMRGTQRGADLFELRQSIFHRLIHQVFIKCDNIISGSLTSTSRAAV